jgi:hypothetical protein
LGESSSERIGSHQKGEIDQEESGHRWTKVTSFHLRLLLSSSPQGLVRRILALPWKREKSSSRRRKSEKG